MRHSAPYIGCAGWNVPGEIATEFPEGGSHLERYSQRFPAVEINSSFYRPHRPSTYARWAESVPDGFRFAVKVPKEITHTLRLKEAHAPLERFLSEAGSLESKLGPLLVQLPPSLRLDMEMARGFFTSLRDRTSANVVCEPRHTTWFTDEAERLLQEYQIARVAADPALDARAAVPGGWDGLAYFRLHGSPEMYHSSYSPAYLDTLAETLRSHIRDARPVWCIFDNTASFAAVPNALHLLRLLEQSGAAPL